MDRALTTSNQPLVYSGPDQTRSCDDGNVATVVDTGSSIQVTPVHVLKSRPFRRFNHIIFRSPSTLNQLPNAVSSTQVTQPQAPQKGDFCAAQVAPLLFLGAQSDAFDLETLLQLNITHVLNVAKECSIPDNIQTALHTKSISLEDHSDENIAMHFSDCSDFIRTALEKNEGVIVHCRMGISRSATIVMAYLMRYGIDVQIPKAMSYDAAFTHVRTTRREACPNFGFCLALREEDVRLGFRKSPWDMNSVEPTEFE